MMVQEHNNLNLELLKEVIEIALNIEHFITKTISVYLYIEKETTKTLGNKSSSLSFKSKIDLLHDLEILDDNEYKDLLLLMEFRNQFLHNIECTSFERCVEILGTDRGRKLITLANVNCKDHEEKYLDGYKRLFIKCLDVIKSKFDQRRQLVEDRRKMIADLLQCTSFVIDGVFEIHDRAFEEFLPDATSSSINTSTIEIISRAMVLQFIADNVNVLLSSKEFEELHRNLQVSFSNERIKRFFKNR